MAICASATDIGGLWAKNPTILSVMRTVASIGLESISYPPPLAVSNCFRFAVPTLESSRSLQRLFPV
ncbi:hypothetical protein EYF80_016280 [Liparis tanakae]|uniref:Uncharacterized protein n=1 Tax=Liparis tanakae TaxID=230148 RepID=A0A4Z2I6Q2_9TELE|nr:hypothetical protein EYF80_016280 [Liparis tanakae]